jgi:Ca2+-binding RTX toxin-like protein
LVVGGTAGNDTIVFNPGQPGQVQVVLNNVSLGTFNGITRLFAYGNAGNDTIQVASTLLLPSVLNGGDGNDTLKAANSPSVLLGGAGSDTLTGGQANDILIGGLGADVLQGNGGDDILIGGTTSFDANDAALCALLAEWSSGHSYSDRVKNLSNGSGSTTYNSRLNQGYFLIPGTTVFDDNAIDDVSGGGGTDWFFALLSGTNKDKVKDQTAGEVVTGL